MRFIRSPHRRRSHAKKNPAATWCALFLSLAAWQHGTAPADACMFSQPPPPVCGKAMHVAGAVPRVELLAGGGTVDVSALVFFDMVDFPPGFGICPAGPYAADLEVTLSCSPGPNGSGSLLSAPISLGLNELSVPVSVPAGPARICTVDIKATVTLGDGMVLTAESDSLLCLGEPAPESRGTSRPRLDLQLLGGAGAEIARAHPGDQASWIYRVTNNDPAESFTGRLLAESLNVARLAGATGPMPPGTGVFSISDPVQGDNFPLAFDDQLFEGCVPLPADPADPAVPTRERPISLAPGQTVDVEIYSRSWGMCADGSCSRGTVLVDGEFSDLSPGLACAGFIFAAETAAAPTYGWPDAGEVAEASAPVAGTIGLSGEPRPGQGRLVTLIWALIGLLVDGLPSPASPILFSETVMPELGRTQVQFLPSEPWAVDSFFDIDYEIQLDIDKPLDASFESMELLEGVPTGFSDVAPAGRGVAEIRDDFGTVDSFFDISYQLEAVGIDNLGDRRQVTWQGVQMDLLPDRKTVRIQLDGGRAGPGAGTELLALELANDLRGFLSPELQGELGLIFTDGFESGNVSAWSQSAP